MAVLKLQTTAEQAMAMEPETAKVYIFLEPSPELIALVPLAKPDEHQGAHCISFVLDSDEAVDQSLKASKWCMDTHKYGREA